VLQQLLQLPALPKIPAVSWCFGFLLLLKPTPERAILKAGNLLVFQEVRSFKCFPSNKGNILHLNTKKQ
jgi:hypothetical protein